VSIRLSSSNNKTYFLTHLVIDVCFSCSSCLYLFFTKGKKKRFKITGSFVKIFCTITRQTSIPLHSLQISANLSLSRRWRHRVAFPQRQTSYCPCDASQCPNAARSEVASRGNPYGCSASGLPPLLFKILCRVCYCYHAATMCWLKCVLDQSTWVLLACTPFAYDFQSYVSCSCANPVAHCCLVLANRTSALGIVCHDVVSICFLSFSCCSSRHASSFFCPFARSAV